KVGGTYELPIFTGSKQFNLKLTLESKEQLKTRMGMREVYRARAETRFSGKLAAKRDMWVYITTDPAHLVVRIDAELGFGRVVAARPSRMPGERPAVTSTASAAPLASSLLTPCRGFQRCPPRRPFMSLSVLAAAALAAHFVSPLVKIRPGEPPPPPR